MFLAKGNAQLHANTTFCASNQFKLVGCSIQFAQPGAGIRQTNAFFYLFTGVHGLHLSGGLVALGMTAHKVWRGFDVNQVRLSVRLCAVYWHFLLALWLVLFSLLTPWVGDFAVICRGLLT